MHIGSKVQGSEVVVGSQNKSESQREFVISDSIRHEHKMIEDIEAWQLARELTHT